jgi:hypothetical protein
MLAIVLFLLPLAVFSGSCPNGQYGKCVGNCGCCDGGRTCYSCSDLVCNGESAGCTDCAAGKYCACSGEIDCPAGKWSGSKSSSCTNCPAGKWSGSGASSCRDCEVGRYGSSTGNTASTCDGPCSAGYYCPAGSTSSTQAPCAAGRYGSSTANNALTCDGPCTAGRYGSSTGNNASTCNGPCSAGYYCPAGSTSSTQNACPAGKFGATSGLQNATCSGDCSAGYYCPAGSTNSTQSACPAGKFGATSGLQNATCSGDCSAGYYCPLSSTSATQVPCPVGRYREDPGGASVSDCTPCAPGKYSPTSASNSRTFCLDCPKGTYNGTAGASALTDCRSCAAGKYNNLTGRASVSACVDCVPGRYSNLPGAIDVATCTACPKGAFNTTPGAVSCGACEPNTYAEQEATAQCTPCAAGKENPSTGSTTREDCTVCPVKTVSTAGDSCKACPAGQITVGTGQAECFSLSPECIKNFMARAPGLGNNIKLDVDCVPLRCPNYMAPTPLACLGCPAGFYGALSWNSTNSDNSTCAVCEDGLRCPGFLPFALQPPTNFRSRGGADCVAASTIAFPGVSFSSQDLPVVQRFAWAFALGGALLATLLLYYLSERCRGALRSCDFKFKQTELPGAAIDKSLAASLKLVRRGNNAALVIEKKTPYGGMFFLGFVLLMLGLWVWSITTFLTNNVQQTTAVIARATDDTLAPLRWAAPAAASPLRPALPPGVNLQLRVFGDARLGCGAPAPFDYRGKPAFADVWDPRSPWLLQPQQTDGATLAWAAASSPACAAGVSLFTLSCANCTLAPDSYLSFALNFTCQSFFMELVFVDALGQVRSLELSPRYTYAAKARLLSAVTWKLAPSVSFLDDGAGAAGGPARGYSVEFTSASAATVDPATEVRGSGVQPLENAVVVRVELPLQQFMVQHTVANRATPYQLLTTLLSFLSLAGVCGGAFRASKLGFHRCVRKKSPLSSAPPPFEAPPTAVENPLRAAATGANAPPPAPQELSLERSLWAAENKAAAAAAAVAAKPEGTCDDGAAGAAPATEEAPRPADAAAERDPRMTEEDAVRLQHAQRVLAENVRLGRSGFVWF